MTTPVPLTGEELGELHKLARAATPGPRFVQGLDDAHAMNLVAVTTVSDTGPAKRWADFDHREIVAATLVQQPRYVDIADERWDENAPKLRLRVGRRVGTVIGNRNLPASQPATATSV